MFFNKAILFFKTSNLFAVIVLMFFYNQSAAQFVLDIHFVDKDTSFQSTVKFQTNFLNKQSCIDYIKKIPLMLGNNGYGNASVDSIDYFTSSAKIILYVGKKGNIVHLYTDSVEKIALAQTDLLYSSNKGSWIDFFKLTTIQQNILTYYENNGFPFASVFLDNIQFRADTMLARLKVNKGQLYLVDSIRIYGKLKLANSFFQRYLEISNKSIYRQNRLDAINKKLSGLTFLQQIQPWDVTMLGTGSVLNLYLNPKKSSQMNFIVGFAPGASPTGKLLLTGEANINLQNAFGYGESLLLNWQQLQVQSPKLTLGYQHPYIFNSPFGADIQFNMFKKDSSYLQVNLQLGVNYIQTANKTGKIFFQELGSNLLASGIDTNQVKITKQLPINIDFNSVGVGVNYIASNTNYKFNPRSGNEYEINAIIGMKTIKKNNEILNLQDSGYNFETLYDSIKLKSYQLKLVFGVAHYFPIGKQGTLKTAINGGILGSTNIFHNELFQIGGFKLLRGFDEESIYATQYGVATVEYRFLTGLNSYFFTFMDASLVKMQYQQINNLNNFVSAGAGMVFETKLGLLNVSYAIGKRSDINTSISNASKIHLGYVTYF